MTAEFLAPFQNRIEVKLAQRLSTFNQPKALLDAMKYACLGGPKPYPRTLQTIAIQTQALTKMFTVNYQIL